MYFFAMAKTVLLNLFSKPATRRYPFEKKEFCAGSRGSVAIEIGKCIFCGICAKKCPSGAIAVDRQKKQWEIERHRCIACGYCVEACPKKALAIASKPASPVEIKAKELFHA